MRRVALIGLATALIFGLGIGVTQAAKAKKLATKIEIEGFEFPGGPVLRFFGDVHSPKNKCERNREVTLRNTGPPKGSSEEVGTVTTDHTGDWEVDVGFEDLTAGPYIANVARKKIKKGDKKIVCKAATSEPFELEDT
jgi:hypothetical protein